MKRLIWGLVFFITLISVNASYFPQPGVIFEFKGALCDSTGMIALNLSHEGNSVRFEDVKITAESNITKSLPLTGGWFIGGDPVYNYDFPENLTTGNNFFGKQRFKFRTTNNIFTKGRYVVTLSWPSNSVYQDEIMFAIECPGIECKSNDGCVSQQTCTNNICEWVKCDEDKFAVGHTCLPKCNDYDACTQDYYIDEKCIYTEIKNCCKSNQECKKSYKCEGNNCVVRGNSLFGKIFYWLKSRYE
jgi:hypothetical protein